MAEQKKRKDCFQAAEDAFGVARNKQRESEMAYNELEREVAKKDEMISDFRKALDKANMKIVGLEQDNENATREIFALTKKVESFTTQKGALTNDKKPAVEKPVETEVTVQTADALVQSEAPASK